MKYVTRQPLHFSLNFIFFDTNVAEDTYSYSDEKNKRFRIAAMFSAVSNMAGKVINTN